MTTSSPYLPPLEDDRWSPTPTYVLLASLGVLSLLLSMALVLFECQVASRSADRPFAAFVLVGILLPALALQATGIAFPALRHLSRRAPPRGPATALFLLSTTPPFLTLLTVGIALARLLLS